MPINDAHIGTCLSGIASSGGGILQVLPEGKSKVDRKDTKNIVPLSKFLGSTEQAMSSS